MDRRHRFAIGATAIMALTGAALGTAALAQDEPVALTYSADDTNVTQARLKGLVDAYMATHPDVTIEIEPHPAGTEGDNLVKTWLATGEMADIFHYNSGSLFQALNATETLVDLSGEPFMDNIIDAWLPNVSAGEGIYGVPSEASLGGGILYNKRIYEEQGLEVPLTWEQFAANNEALKAAGIPPVCATFGATWTSQLFVLADYYNVQTAVPDFAEKYTNNQAKYADTPAAAAGFEHLQEGYDKGWWQPDYAADTFERGQELIAKGECAHYPMLTLAVGGIAANFPEQADDVGFFAQPGTDAAKNGLTLWMPAATYIPTTTEGAKLDAAKDFLAFIASVEGTEAMSAGSQPTGPYMIEGSVLPDDVPAAIKDLQPYIDAGNYAPALEFVSPIKGPSLEQLTVAVGSGINTAEEAAALYDQDVEKQAQQLGLPGW